jgi:hypothetical protein
MKKKLFVLLTMIMVLSLMSIPALAGPPDNNASGDWCYDLVDGTDVKFADGNTFVLDFNDTGHWNGTFVGDSVDNGWIVMRARGYWVFNTTVSLENVKVLGKTGDLEMRVNGWLPAPPAGDPPDFSQYEGLWVITRATEGLRGLVGRGTWDGGPTETDCYETYGVPYGVPYTGNVHFKNE